MDPSVDKLIDGRCGEFLFPARFVLALSGGVDSCALLHWLCARGQKPLVAHYNHRWHPREDGHAAFCGDLARGAGLPFVEGSAPAQGVGSEASARRERYDFLVSVATAHRCPAIVTAHHSGDQAETLLLRLVRGAGSRGLAAMRPRTERGGVAVLRPWLAVSRSEILAYARAHRLRWVEDPFNRDTTKKRSLVRTRVLPYLERHLGPGVEARLCRAADHLAREDEFLQELAVAALAQARDRSRPELLVVPALQAQPPALQHRVVRLWLEGAGVPDISGDDVGNVIRLMGVTKPASCNLAGGYIVRRRSKRLVLER